MAITKEDKSNYILKYAKSSKDTGSIPAQVAILTHRINSLTEHLKLHKKDEHSKRGLISLVNKRKADLKYLKKRSPTAYDSIVESLGIRG